MIRYVFSDVVPIRNAAKADPQAIGEALAQVAEAAKGELKPADVVAQARSSDHPLHPYFEWDDKLAAEICRVDQARALIRCVRVVEDDSRANAPAFLSISDKGGTSYRTLGEVQSSADLQAVILRQAERDLEAFEGRYRALKDICSLVRVAREAISKRRRGANRQTEGAAA